MKHGQMSHVHHNYITLRITPVAISAAVRVNPPSLCSSYDACDTIIYHLTTRDLRLFNHYVQQRSTIVLGTLANKFIYVLESIG